MTEVYASPSLAGDGQTDPAESQIFWTLGLLPVQQWIAEARRSRDLLVGSRVLSWLLKKVLHELLACDATVQIPDTTGLSPGPFEDELPARGYSLPNRATGSAPLDSGPRVEKALRRIQHEGLATWWNELADKTRADNAVPNELLRALPSPMPCPIEIVWCLCPASSGEGLAAVEELYLAVKRSRPVRASRGWPVRKCGQCAKRDALGGTTWKEWRDFHSRLNTDSSIQRGLRLEPRELLCGPCTVKRLLGYLGHVPFPSTSRIASNDWLFQVRSVPELRELLRSLDKAAKAVPGFELDPEPLYYPRTLRRLQQLGGPSGQELALVAEARESLVRKIRRIAREGDRSIPPAPSNYAAVLVFDGDSMGRHVQEDAEMPKKLRRFAERLSAELMPPEEPATVRTKPERPGLSRAQPFYMGGDEGLLIAPLGDALAVALRVRELWGEVVGPAANAEPNEEVDRATLSMGIAVFDRERPLGAAIEAAHGAVVEAKGLRPAKDALAVTVQTPSGSRWTGAAAWDAWAWVSTAANLVRNGGLSHGWAYDVAGLLRDVSVSQLSTDEVAEAVNVEIRRLTRQRGDGGEAGALQVLEQRGFPEQVVDPALSPAELAQLPSLLHLVAFLARETKGSEPSEEIAAEGAQ